MKKRIEEARKVIRMNRCFTLSGPAWKVFRDALASPPPPNAALRKAFARYEKLTNSVT